MLNPVLVAAVLAISIPLSACGYSVVDAAEDISNGGFDGGKEITTSVQTTDAFTAVEAMGPDNVILVTGDAFSIKAEGNAEAIKLLRFKIDGNAIQIGRKKGKWFGDSGKAVTITITAPKVSAVALAGSGDFKGDKLSGDKVVIDLAGSGSADVADISAPLLEGNIAGSGDIRAAGKAAKAEWSVAGSGNVDAASIISEQIEISIAGSGDVRANASKSADVSIAGSGDVNVSGGANCTKSVIGSGKVNCG
jgi:Putative auto-transporter adhesin, head GIN domain